MNKNRILFMFLGLVLIVGFTKHTFLFAQSVDDLTIMTEIYPPYNFEDNGELKGISVDLMVLMLARVGSKLDRDDIKLGPWARGYQTVLKKKNTVLFSTTRTKEREPLFKWVGPIIPTTISVFAKKEKNIEINSIEDIKKYKTGVVIDDIGEHLLLAEGIELKDLDRMGGTNVILQSIKKLDKGRIDLFPYQESAAKWMIKKNGFNPNDYEVVYILKKSKLYYAFHKDTPDTLLKKLQDALDALKKDGEYQVIVDKYTK